MSLDPRKNWDLTGYTVLRSVASEYGFHVRGLTGPGRTKALVSARATVAVRLRKQGWTLADIGDLLGGRHHTTVMNLLETA